MASSSDVCSVLGHMMLKYGHCLVGPEHSGYASPDLVNTKLGIFYCEGEKTKYLWQFSFVVFLANCGRNHSDIGLRRDVLV